MTKPMQTFFGAFELALPRTGGARRWNWPPVSPLTSHILSGAALSATLLFVAFHAQAQSGALDASFMSQVGPNSNVNAVVVQPDGKVVFAGLFTTVNLRAQNRLARADTNGNLDATFSVGAGPNAAVNALALQGDGGILLAGLFTNFNGTPRAGLARVTWDGKLDPSFDPGSGTDGRVSFVAWQTNGQVTIQGDFTSYNGTPRLGLARLNADGSLDPSFDPGDRAGDVSALACQPDGKVVFSGSFLSLDGFAVTNLARLNADGSLDTNFCAVAGLNPQAYADSVSLQSDGKILLSGLFTNVNGIARSRVGRLNADGTLDSSFDPGTGFNLTLFGSGRFVRSVAQPNHQALVWGNFSAFNGTTRNAVARLLENGQLDAGFNPAWGITYARSVAAVGFPSGGKLLVGDKATTLTSRLRRYLTNGVLDASWMSEVGANQDVQTILQQPDGKLVLCGWFTTFNGTPRFGLVRLAADGELDPSFTANVSTNNGVMAAALQPDGKFVVAGDFFSLNGTPQTNVARLNSDGSVDASFDAGLGPDGYVYAVTILTNGAILMGGEFVTWNGELRLGLVRLDDRGRLDTSFDAGLDGNVTVMALQPDGKVLLGGNFTQILGVGRTNVARLNSDGSLEAGFIAPVGISGWVGALGLQPDGKIFVAGDAGATGKAIHRLHPDGRLDTNFVADLGASGPWVGAVVPQRDGRILIAGDFWIGGIFQTVSRLNPDGSWDSSFALGTTPSVNCLALQADTQLLIGGGFSNIKGAPRGRIARVVNDLSVQPVPSVSGSYLTTWAGRSTVLRGFAAGLPPVTYHWQCNGTNLPGQTNLECWLPNTVVSDAGLYALVAANASGTATSGPVRLTVLPALARPGVLDTNWAIGAGPSAGVWHIAEHPDGQLLLAGAFGYFNGEPHGGLVRLLATGDMDTNFSASGVESGAQGYCSAVMPDGKIVVGGWFTSFNGLPRYNLARLETNGVLDESFTASVGESDPSAWVWPIIPQPDGKLLVGGLFNLVNGETVTNLVRLELDGSIDHNFAIGAGPSDYVGAIALQSDGKILVGGMFGYFDGVVRGRITRLNTNGTLDASFNAGTALNHAGEGVDAIVLQPDGKMLIGGAFTAFNNVPRPNVARLHPDGSLDTSFAPPAPPWLAASMVYGLALQPDGRVLVGTWPPGGSASACVARLNPDGSLDPSFQPGFCSTDGVWFLTRLSNGRVMAGGGFPDFNGAPTPYLARLHGDEALLPESISLTLRLNGGLQFEWPSVTGALYQLQSATSLPAANWLDEGAPFPGTGGVLTTNLPLGPEPRKFFRLQIENGP